MAEPQLVDYIKKAKETGQSDEQTRALLYKNGWTEAEVSDAFADVNKSQPEVQPQQPQIKTQPDVQPQTQKPTETKPQYHNEPVHKSSHLVLKLFVVLIILAIIGGVGYFAMNMFSFSAPTVSIPVIPAVEKTVKNTAPASVATGLATVKITSVSPEFDITKMTVFAFSKAGDKVAFCLPKISDGKISCFLNDQVLVNPYSYRPSWAGFSPDGKRLAFVYSDPSTKQTFVYESGKESARYDGTISGPAFSNDSKSFMFIVNGTDKKSFVVLNGNIFNSHDKIYGAPVISDNGKYVLYGARDGQDLSWVADEIK